MPLIITIFSFPAISLFEEANRVESIIIATIISKVLLIARTNLGVKSVANCHIGSESWKFLFGIRYSTVFEKIET